MGMPNSFAFSYQARSLFGFTELYGDVRYDWAKLYYSIAGNYDRFNLKDFRLEIGEKEVFLSIGSNHWEDMDPWKPWNLQTCHKSVHFSQDQTQ